MGMAFGLLISSVVTLVSIGCMVVIVKELFWAAPEDRAETTAVSRVGMSIVMGSAVGTAVILAGAPAWLCAGLVVGALVLTAPLTTRMPSLEMGPPQTAPMLGMSAVTLLVLSAAVIWRWVL